MRNQRNLDQNHIPSFLLSGFSSMSRSVLDHWGDKYNYALLFLCKGMHILLHSLLIIFVYVTHVQLNVKGENFF